MWILLLAGNQWKYSEGRALSFSWDILIITWIIYNMQHASFWVLKELKDDAEIRLLSHWKRHCNFVPYLKSTALVAFKMRNTFILNFRQRQWLVSGQLDKKQRELSHWNWVGVWFVFVMCLLGQMSPMLSKKKSYYCHSLTLLKQLRKPPLH